MITSIKDPIIEHLKKDSVLRPLVENFTITIDKTPSKVFDELIRSIVSQQLSISAANTIFNRFLALLDHEKDKGFQISQMPIETLRSAGLSFQKSSYLKNVAQHFHTFQLHDVDWSLWKDEEIVQELTKIKGVGKWTAEMILMFSLNRPDVLPLDDLIIKNNIQKLYKVQSEKKQLIIDLTAIAESWRPYRSYACRYLWTAKNSSFIP